MVEMPFELGETVTFRKTVAEVDVYLFAGITGDLSPNHVDAEFMAATSYGARIAHGTLVLGYTSAASTMLVQQHAARAVSYGYDRVRLTAPVFFGDTITVTYRVVEVLPEEQKVRSQVEVRKSDGTLCLVATHILKLI